MMEALEAAAKRMPEDPRGDIWPGVVKELRQVYNARYQATMQAERLRAEAQKKVDRELGETYMQRMFDPTRSPTEQEILLDSKLSTEKRKDLVNIMRSLNKVEPRPDENARNEVEAIRRMGLPDDDPQKISNERQLTQLLIDKQITAQTWHTLRQDFERQNNTREANVNKEQTRLIDRAGPLLNPTKRAAGAGMSAFTDPTGGHAQREAAYADYVIQSIRAARDDPKALRALLDPNPENKQYLGRQELLQQYGEYGAIGRPIMEKAAEIASQKPQAPIDRTKIKSNQDIQKLLQDGKLGPPGSPQAVQAARQLSIDMGFSRPPVTVAPPVQ
jgi:hypothetical protein